MNIPINQVWKRPGNPFEVRAWRKLGGQLHRPVEDRSDDDQFEYESLQWTGVALVSSCTVPAYSHPGGGHLSARSGDGAPPFLSRRSS